MGKGSPWLHSRLSDTGEQYILQAAAAGRYLCLCVGGTDIMDGGHYARLISCTEAPAARSSDCVTRNIQHQHSIVSYLLPPSISQRILQTTFTLWTQQHLFLLPHLLLLYLSVLLYHKPTLIPHLLTCLDNPQLVLPPHQLHQPLTVSIMSVLKCSWYCAC